MKIICKKCGELIKSGKGILYYDEKLEKTIPICITCKMSDDMKKERCDGGV